MSVRIWLVLGAVGVLAAATPADAPASDGLLQPVQYDGARWADAAGGAVPPGAFAAGREGPPNFETLFVCRTNFNGSMQIGKVRPGLGNCNVPFGGQEMTIPTYQVLVGNYRWVPGGGVPPGAMRGGHDMPPQSIPLFVCQAPYAGGVHPGKTRPDWDTCHVAWGGREIPVREYSVLVQ